MREMLKMRAKLMMGGIEVDQLHGSIARVFFEAEEDMDDGEEGMLRAKTAMEVRECSCKTFVMRCCTSLQIQWQSR